MSKRDPLNKTVAAELLVSYRRVLFEVKTFFDSVDFNDIDDIETKIKLTKSILDSGKALGDNIDSLDKLEEKVKRDQKEHETRKGGVEKSLFED